MLLRALSRLDCPDNDKTAPRQTALALAQSYHRHPFSLHQEDAPAMIRKRSTRHAGCKPLPTRWVVSEALELAARVPSENMAYGVPFEQSLIIGVSLSERRVPN